MLWCKHLNYQRVNTWVVQNNDTSNWFQHKLCCITDQGYDKVSSITKEGLKLMPAWWRSQPNKCRVRERRPIRDRHQSISLKCRLSLKLSQIITNCTTTLDTETIMHHRNIDCYNRMHSIWRCLYMLISIYTIILNTICRIWYAFNLID